MKRSVTFAYPGNLALNTGGYAYDRRVISGLGDYGWSVDPLPLGNGFPFPAPHVRRAAERRLSDLPDGTLVIIDGLAFGVLDEWAKRETDRLRIVALVHHPLALETGLDSTQQTSFRDRERRALSFARHIIVTSPMTARQLETQYDVPQHRITVAIPGTDPAPAATGIGDPPHILSIGTLSPRKGHDVLISALKQVENLAWRATIVGSKSLYPQTAALLAQQIEALGLTTRISLAGECDDPRAVLAGADIFALASRFEGYGMVFAEALSQGLPIVACRSGAVPDVVPDDAGILVPVDDVGAFAEALASLLIDKDLRLAKAEAARRAGAQLPGWATTAEIISTSLGALA
ncbi:glycosyltransferase family 4 protein [Agrobacterium sp. a22-2]|uniref:glycosyltransferase family 4 protein n=1 Tax=Agrobacterium sp. a22-2 TaxID=2283840 RepID=UPI00144595E5|nr:glycosyltransferase family 4 protein [Agrobacterium sp. a22-2]NKN38943.1 glycosyltransferase family 4 protein [Agrobacterium sp. a22-2]